MNDLVSVIVPVYNAEKYLNECINSLICQTYSTIEIILVNDGSKDSSDIICESFCSDFRVKVFHNDNHGVGYSRNYGIEKATGQYIVFVDSDDICDVELINNLYNCLTNSDADLAICGLSTFDDRKANTNTIVEHSGIFTIADYLSKVLLNVRIGQICGAPYCKLFKSSIINNNHLRFNTDVSYAEDFGFNMDYLLFCKKIVVIEESLYRYRENSVHSLTTSNYKYFSKDQYLEHRLIAYRKFEAVYSHYELLDLYRNDVNLLMGEFIISTIKMSCKYSFNKNETLLFIKGILNDEYIQKRLNYRGMQLLDSIRIKMMKKKKSSSLYYLESFRYKVGFLLGKC